MAQRKVYFYELDLFRTENDDEVNYCQIKDLLINIINEVSREQGDYRTLDLTLDDDPLHVILDVFEYEQNRLFCRLSRQKPKCTFLERDYRTYEKADLLGGENEETKGIEKYTYGYLNYETGIFSIVKAVEAPKEKVFANVFVKYCRDYYIKLTSIPNAYAIDSIYMGEEAKITKLSIEIPIPNVETLQPILGWNNIEMMEAISEGAASAVVEIKAPIRQSITNNSEDTVGIIDCIREARNHYRKAKIKAKAKNVKLQEYNFYDEYFSYPVDINNYHIENYERVYYSVDELVDIYRQNMIMAYNENRTIIETITGREINEGR